MANYFVNIDAGIEKAIAFNIFSILADKDCGEIVLGKTRYTKNGNSFNANLMQYEIKLNTEEKPIEKHINYEKIKTKAPKQIKRKHHKLTIEDKKEYQHEYYMRVTKEKRRKARTEKNILLRNF